MKILMVDDSRALHAYVVSLLKEENYELDHAFNGQEALQILSRVTQPYDLILLDWEMPEMTGPQTLGQIKTKGISTPVIMMTSRNSTDDLSSMMAAGAAEYIIKPFTKDIIIEKIGSLWA